MRILFIGDVVAAPGRHILEKHLGRLQREYNIDFTIVNGENSSGGFGMNKKAYNEMTDLGVDAFTMGNHIWDNKDIFNFIDQDTKIVRPANFPSNLPGAPWRIFDVQGQKIAITNVVGRVYMPPAECPYAAVDAIITQVRQLTPLVIVDIHAEATSEKMAMGWYLDGRVSAVLGTHTHVQTNDARILPKGTAYISDAGMTGPRDSVLGMDKDIIVKKFTTGMPVRFEIATGDLQFNAVVFEVDANGRALSIETINFFEPAI